MSFLLDKLMPYQPNQKIGDQMIKADDGLAFESHQAMAEYYRFVRIIRDKNAR